MIWLIQCLTDILAVCFLLAGVFFHATACLGILRMPDVYMRLSGISMAGTLGNMCYLIAASAYFGTASMVGKACVIVFFLYITAPISGHILGRASYLYRVPLWKKSVVDEWAPILSSERHAVRVAKRGRNLDMNDPDVFSGTCRRLTSFDRRL